MRTGLALVVSATIAVAGAPPLGAAGPAPEGDVAVTRLLVHPEQPSSGAPQPTAVKRRYAWRIPRASKDRPDRRRGRQVHVVYLTSSNLPAPPLDRLGILEDSMRSQNVWLARRAGRQWRVDTFAFRWRRPGARRARRVVAVDVTTVRSGLPEHRIDSLGEIAEVLTRRGLNRPDKRYLVYAAADAGYVCGEGEYPLSNDPRVTGRYSAVYLYSHPGCGSRAFAPNRRRGSWAEAIAQQELMHNDAAVPLVAPRDCRPAAVGHVCTPGLMLTDLDPEIRDVMFPFVTGPLRKKVVDRGRDDYYRHPFPYRDLKDSPFLVVG